MIRKFGDQFVKEKKKNNKNQNENNSKLIKV